MSKKARSTINRTDPMKQMSLKSFISKKDKTSNDGFSSTPTESEPQVTTTTASEDTNIISSPSILKRKVPFTKKTSSIINLVHSDSDDNSRSPLRPLDADRKRLPPKNIFKEQIDQQISGDKFNANGYDEFDDMVEGRSGVKKINYDPIELNLSSDSRYTEATRKLEDNLNRLTKNSPVKAPKFQYKLPTASRLSLELSKTNAYTNSIHPEDDDDDDFATKKKIMPSFSTPKSPKNAFSDMERLLSPGKGMKKIRFDERLSPYLDTVTESSGFTSKSLHERDIPKNVQFLQETQVALLNHLYDIVAQVPAECFQQVDKDFNVACFDRLKSTIEIIRGKIKVYDRVLAKKDQLLKTTSVDKVLTDRKVGTIPKTTSSTSSTTSTAPIIYDLPFEDSLDDTDVIQSTLPYESESRLKYITPKTSRFENLQTKSKMEETNAKTASTHNPDLGVVGPSKSAGAGTAFVFKKPIASTLANNSDVQINGISNGITDERKSLSPFKANGVIEEDDDLADVDDILNNIREAEMIDQGRSFQTNISAVDLITPDHSMRQPDPPRITFPVEAMPRNTQFIENINTQLDDDGWQVYDASMYEDSMDSSMSAPVNVPPRSAQATTSVQATGSDIGRFHEGVRNDGITGEFDGMSYPHSDRLQIAFKETFGLRTFRPNQLQVINATLLGKDCFVLMPTGGGKSLCYQLPALLTIGLTIVVSPLKSLILDQVQKLNSLDIPAGNLSGEADLADVQRIYDDLYSRCPELKLLYVTPEKICSSAKFQNLLTALYRRGLLGRIVIDEAHCVSAWGHDFRPDYKKLSVLREQFPTVPIIALTATANPRVRMDILAQLRLARDTRWFLSSFNRPNLKYLVLPKKGASTKAEMIDLIRKKFPRDTGIVYCLSKKECDQLAQEFRQAGIKAKSYHAGLTDNVRASTQKEWIGDRIKVVCATIAFGMGIDKPDVRYVLHYCMPKSIEGYYQEAGRAGRDGEIATCILYYNYSDMLRYRKMIDNDTTVSMEAKQINVNNLFRMVNYCENVTDCRRTQQLEYFAEYFTSEQCLSNRATACDNCLMQGNYKQLNATDDCIMIAKAVRDLCSGRNRFTLLHMVEVLKGSEIKKVMENGHNRTAYHGKLKSWERCDIQRLLRKLVIEEYLREDLIFSNDIPQAYLRIGSKIESLVGRRVRIDFAIKEKQQARGKVTKTDVPAAQDKASSAPISAELRDLQMRCYNDLLEICRTIAMQKNATLASIMNIQALKTMSEKLPESPAEMLALPHVTKANFEKYGKQLLDITQNYAAEKLCLIMDTQEQEEAKAAAEEVVDGDSEDSDVGADGTNWGDLARTASQSGSGGRGYKRRGSWGAGSAKVKRFRKGTGTRKATSKRASGATTSRGSKRGSASKRGTGGSRTTARSDLGLLPMPGGY